MMVTELNLALTPASSSQTTQADPHQPELTRKAEATLALIG